MPKAEFTSLKRRQLDDRLIPMAGARPTRPRGGWIRAIRSALGMTQSQLAKRLRITRPSIADAEASEAANTITLERLERVANALQCDLMYVLVPRAGSLEETVRQRATQKAAELRAGVLHTMALEKQAAGVRESASMYDVEWWISSNLSRLWD